MRKRIEELADEIFEYGVPELSFSTERIELETFGGKDLTGEFTVVSKNHVPMKGMVSSSCFRMECLTPAFEGEEATIRYQFHGEGLTEGDIIKGDFFLVLNQGEYSLSFVVSILELYADTAVGRVRTLGDFARLAEENFTEAYRLFYSPKFMNIIKSGRRQGYCREELLYQGLSGGAPSGQKIEEFLIGTGRKKKVDVSIKSSCAEFTGVTERGKGIVELRRSGWGYLELSISSDAPFLIPSKKRISEEDFIGSICPFEYYVDETAFHAGKNYGSLTFSMPQKTLVFSVCATKNECMERTELSEHQQIREARIRLTQLYIDYRLKKLVTGVWASHSIEYLNHLIALEPDRPLYRLMKAQAFLSNKQRQEALWILEDFRRTWEDKNAPVWGYYLYLSTLVEREPSYIDRVTAQIEQLYRKNPGDDLLFFLLLFLRETYCENRSEKLKAIRQWRLRGCISPFLYVEAYYLYQKEPYLLRKLEGFELEVIRWAVRQEALTADVARQVTQLVREQRNYDARCYPILKECYRVLLEDETLEILCGYLIRGRRFDFACHRWYELGITKKLRMTGLYDAYLMSLDGREVGRVPRMIQMYFQYDSKLPAKQKAVLYVNILAQKQKEPEVYQNYSRLIGQFAVEQIREGQIDDNLAVIYQEVLSGGFFDAEMAEHLKKVLFVHKITCMQEHIARALIYEPWKREPQTVTFSENTAYFTAYVRDYCVILEDSFGNRFSDTEIYRTEILLNPERYIGRCNEMAPGQPEYLLYRLLNGGNAGKLWLSDRETLLKLADLPEISETFRMSLFAEIIRFCREKGYADDVKLLLKKVAFDRISAADRRQLTEILAEQGMEETAYRLVRDYGYEQLDGQVRRKICSYAITQTESEEDDFLLDFAAAVFFYDTVIYDTVIYDTVIYDSTINGSTTYGSELLSYLCRYYQGPTKRMAQLWKAAKAALSETSELEERILTQLLYTTEYIADIENIYDSYTAEGELEPLGTAYLNYFANEYLRKEAVVPDIFSPIMKRYRESAELNDTQKFAVLKYFSVHAPVLPWQEEMLQALLGECVGRGIYFAFYLKYDKGLLKKYHLCAGNFLEYHTNPSCEVQITYRVGEREYVKEEMTEVYDGIFVRMFLMFYGDEIQYYITENDGLKEETTVSGCIRRDGCGQEGCLCSYGRLNQLLEDAEAADYESLKQGMREYYRIQHAAEELFGLL